MSSIPAEIKESAFAPCAFVLFGATGDLTKRKIIPALYSISSQNLLPSNFVIVAFARRDKTDEDYRKETREHIREFAPKLSVDGPEWEKFSEHLFYVRSEFDDADGYHRLASRLTELDQQFNLGGNHLFYLAT